MDRFVARQNLAHYRDLLAEETDPEKRKVLERLLAEEERKTQILADSPAKPDPKT